MNSAILEKQLQRLADALKEERVYVLRFKMSLLF